MRDVFANRATAGMLLARQLPQVGEATVCAIPRGGVAVAKPIADQLSAPLTVVGVRKLGAPGHPELGMGAIGEGGVVVLNRQLLPELGVTTAEIDAVAEQEAQELSRRLAVYRPQGPVDLGGRTALIVDDGLATGYTALAAVEVTRRWNAVRVVLAVPVAPPETIALLEEVCDEVVVLRTPADLWSVGTWYDDFRQTTDEEVIGLLSG